MNGLDASGSEVDADWEEGCIVDLPFSAFRQSLKIDCGPVPLLLEPLDVALYCRTTTNRRRCKENSGPDLPIGPWHKSHHSITKTRDGEVFLR